MNCKKCGKRLGKDEIICKRCGNDSSVEEKADIISNIKSQLQEKKEIENNIVQEQPAQVEPVQEEPVADPIPEVTNYEMVSNREEEKEVVNTKTEGFDTITNMDAKDEKVKNPLPTLIIVICILLCAIIFVKIKIDQYKIDEGIDNEITLQDLELKERKDNNNKKNNYLNETNTTGNDTANETETNTTNTVENAVNETPKTENVIAQDSINGNLVNEILEKRSQTNSNTKVSKNTVTSNGGINVSSSYKTKNSNE